VRSFPSKRQTVEQRTAAGQRAFRFSLAPSSTRQGRVGDLGRNRPDIMQMLARNLFLALALIGAVGASRAELIVALTPSDALTPGAASLLTFTSQDPGQILSAVPISGLQTNEQVLGIDARPATGELYALTDGARLYVINPTTGVATLRATLAAVAGDPFTGLSGTKFGVDFNPASDSSSRDQ